MKPIETERLILRNWQNRDRDLFHVINSDERVMEFFPFRRDRPAADAIMDILRDDADEQGFGFVAVELKSSGRVAGFCGITEIGFDAGRLAPGSIEIGWRLAPEFWGKGYATEAAQAWLDFGFAEAQLEQIVSFAVESNRRSTSVMKRLGMARDPALDFCHPKVPDSHPHLKPHVVYRIDRAGWQRTRGRQT